MSSKINPFDLNAAEWDNNPMRVELVKNIVSHVRTTVYLNKEMSLFEYGAGTGLISVMLSGEVKDILMADTSEGMLKVLNEKIVKNNLQNLKAIRYDLETTPALDERFDVIIASMVLHHIVDTGTVISRFHSMLKAGGVLLIADLLTEDGSFHGPDFTGHKGFAVSELSAQVEQCGLTFLEAPVVYKMQRTAQNGTVRHYPVFLLSAVRTA